MKWKTVAAERSRTPLQAHTPREAIWNQMYGFLIYVGIMLAVIHYGSKAIKTHVTYPRTGFVEYRMSYEETARKEALEEAKKMGLETVEPGMQLLYRPSIDDEQACFEFGQNFARRVKAYHETI